MSGTSILDLFIWECPMMWCHTVLIDCQISNTLEKNNYYIMTSPVSGKDEPNLSLWPEWARCSYLARMGYRLCIPAYFSNVKCVRFSILTLPQFPKMSDDFRRFPKITEGFRWFPSIGEDDPTTSDHTSCFDKLTTEFTFNWSMSKKLAFVSQAWEIGANVWD